MKIIFVFLSLFIGVLCMVYFMDLLMSTMPSDLIGNTLGAFRVMEPAEYIISFIFLFFLLINFSIVTFRSKKGS